MAAAAAFFVLAIPARAGYTDARLDAIASRYAEQPVTVLCYDHDERIDEHHVDPLIWGAWGYVWLVDDKVNLAKEVCDGLEQALAGGMSVWAGLGALVLTHESYHLALRYGDSRGDEAKTECRAVRHVWYTLQFLGLSGSLLRAGYFWALTWDWQLIWSFPQYFDKTCQRDHSGELLSRFGSRMLRF